MSTPLERRKVIEKIVSRSFIPILDSETSFEKDDCITAITSFLEEEVERAEKGALKKLEKAMDNYKFYAGVWHLDTCDFPEVDQAVCNCDHTKIRKHILALPLPSRRYNW